MSYHSSTQVTFARFKERLDISASTSSAATASGVSAHTSLVCIHNLTDATAYVASGPSTVTVSTSNGFPIAAGAYHYLKVTPGEYVAAVLASSTGTVAVCEMTQ